jgi:hypothetical protein
MDTFLFVFACFVFSYTSFHALANLLNYAATIASGKKAYVSLTIHGWVISMTFTYIMWYIFIGGWSM